MTTQQLSIRLAFVSLVTLTFSASEQVQPIAPSRLINCTLTTTQPFSLPSLLIRNPVFIILRLNFTDLVLDSDLGYLRNTPNAIDSLSWTWASKGKGYLLRSLSPNFRHLSLRTLDSGVYHKTLNISVQSCKNFLNASDNTKLNTVARFIVDTFFDTYAELDLISKQFKVCQEFYTPTSKTKGTFKAWLLNLHVFLYLPQSLELRCWRYPFYTETHEGNESFMWTSILYYVILIIGVTCFPLLILVIIQSRPPVRDDSSYRLYSHTNLPVGLQYTLFIWKDNNRAVWTIRRVMLILFIALLNYAEAICLRVTSTSYPIRRSSAFRSVVSQNWLYLFGLLFNAFYSIVLFVIMCKTMKKEKAFPQEHTIDRKCLFFFIELRKGFFIPEAPKYYPWGNSLFWYMKRRMEMAVDLNLVWNGLPILDPIESIRSIGYHGVVIYMVLKIIISALLWISILIFNSPFIYILQLLIVHWLRSFKTMNNYKIVYRIIAGVFWALSILGLFGIIRFISGFVSLLANVCEYTITGIFVNTKELQPEFFLALTTLIYFVKTITSFYDNYHRLLIVVIEKAMQLNKYLSNAKSTRVKNDSIDSKTASISQSFQPLDQSSSAHSSSHDTSNPLNNNIRGSYEHSDDKGLGDKLKPSLSFGKPIYKVSISDHLFWYIVGKCQPVRLQVIQGMLNLAGISFLLLVGFEILKQVNQQSHISDSATILFSLGISFAVPILKSTIHSNINQEIRKNQLEREIEKALIKYPTKFPEKLPLVSFQESSKFVRKSNLYHDGESVVENPFDQSENQRLVSKDVENYSTF
ncbi:uncharacterized protein [Amphiura filiformis]|uniref:uncharacterized protein n=1 Tax=Amphiura filiformis TaxID=82378 RepID=UPI003B213B2B